MGEVDCDVWVIVPAFNEARAIEPVLIELLKTGHHILVVNDGSSDATASVARNAGCAVVTHPINLGQGAALQTGIDYALSRGGEFIVTFDADGQHRASDIETLLQPLVLNGADFALGSRFLTGCRSMPASRRLLLRLATAFTRLTTGLPVTDAHNGLRAMTRRGAMHINLRQNRMAHASEILDQIAASGLRFVEVPMTVEYTRYSLAKGQKSTDSINILVDLLMRRLHS